MRGDYLAVGGSQHYMLLYAGFSQRIGNRWLAFHYLVGPVYGNHKNNWIDQSCSRAYPLTTQAPDCGPPPNWEHIDRDFWGGSASAALDLVPAPFLLGLQGSVHLPLYGDDAVPIGFAGIRLGAEIPL